MEEGQAPAVLGIGQHAQRLHAWSASDRELLASSDVAWVGRNDGHVML